MVEAVGFFFDKNDVGSLDSSGIKQIISCQNFSENLIFVLVSPHLTLQKLRRTE